MDFARLIAPTLPFYGVVANCFKIGDTVFEVVCNDDEDYQSLSCIVELDCKHVFAEEPLALVHVEERVSEVYEGYQIVDANDGHVWLIFGTYSTDIFSSVFIFRFTAKGEEQDAQE